MGQPKILEPSSSPSSSSNQMVLDNSSDEKKNNKSKKDEEDTSLLLAELLNAISCSHDIDSLVDGISCDLQYFIEHSAFTESYMAMMNDGDFLNASYDIDGIMHSTMNGDGTEKNEGSEVT